ncbi:MAG: tetratricopeptide (TPR) repeat protein [Myxococcota bacterium]|jgi:tetratricopeptide (TPR) repeat protein
MLRLSAILVFASTLTFGADASAQEVDPSPEEQHSPEDRSAVDQAREHYRTGMSRFDAHDYRSAIAEFHLAARLVPSADLWFNIARAHEEMGELAPAVEHYQLYLRDRVDPPDRQAIQARIASLQRRAEEAREAAERAPTTGTLRLSSNLEGARILLDGQEIGHSPLTAPMELSPGRHELALEHDGYLPFRSTVRLEAGLTTAAYADLQPATGYRAVRGRRIWTWITGGLAVAGGAAAIGVGAHARGLRDENLGDARRWARYSDIALGSAVVMALTSVILYFVEGRAIETERFEGPEESAP